MVVIAGAISSIFGSGDIGLDKRMESTKCEEVPRELEVTLLVSDGEEEVTIWIFNKFPKFTEFCLLLDSQAPGVLR